MDSTFLLLAAVLVAVLAAVGLLIALLLRRPETVIERALREEQRDARLVAPDMGGLGWRLHHQDMILLGVVIVERRIIQGELVTEDEH